MSKNFDIATGAGVDTSLFVQKDVNGAIEALDGSALTNLTADNLGNSGTIPSQLLEGVGGGIYEEIASYDIGNDSEVFAENVFTDTYDNYMVLLQGISMETNNQDFYLRFYKADGSYTAEHTYAAQGQFHNNFDESWSGSNSSAVKIMQAQGSGAGKTISGVINFFDMKSSIDGLQRYTWQITGRKHDTNNGVVVGGGTVATASERTGFKLLASSGNLMVGTVVVYGIKKPT